MNRIKQLRKEKKMTQIRLSIELDVSQETVSAYESGKHFPSIPILLKMSEIFNASCDYILGLSDVKCIQNGGEYNSDEIALISLYRILSPFEKKMTKAYMQGIFDKSHNISG